MDLLICADAFPHRQSFPRSIFFISINKCFLRETERRRRPNFRFSIPPLSPFIGDRHRTDIFAHTRKTFFLQPVTPTLPFNDENRAAAAKTALNEVSLICQYDERRRRRKSVIKISSVTEATRRIVVKILHFWVSRFFSSSSLDFLGPGFRQIFIFLGA